MESDRDLFSSDNDVLAVQLADAGFSPEQVRAALDTKKALDSLTPAQRSAMAEAPGKN